MVGTLIAMETELAVNRFGLAALIASALVLHACGSETSYAEATDEASGEGVSIDGDAALELASEDLSDQTFEDVGDTSQCTEDCSGHGAGFEWAKENDVTDPSDCGGNSRSFEEGCDAYGEALEDQASEYESEDEF